MAAAADPLPDTPTLPKDMRAFVETDYGTTVDLIQEATLPLPAVSRGMVLVKVVACGLNAGDTKLAGGFARVVMKLKFPLIIGRDVAGVVVHVAQGTETPLVVGDRVYGLNENAEAGQGTFAEYVACRARDVVKIADHVKFHEVAGLPVSLTTSYQALVRRNALKPGVRILILGGSSGTGLAAIQLAKAHGCSDIIVTSSQVDTCLRLGATRVINHREGEKWEESLKGAKLDVVYNTVQGKEAWYAASRVLKPSGGRYITINIDNPHTPPAAADFCGFMGALAWRKSWSWLGYPTFEFHVGIDDPAGLAEGALLAAAGKLVSVPHGGAVQPMTLEAVREMWGVQMAGRAHGRCIFMWENA